MRTTCIYIVLVLLLCTVCPSALHAQAVSPAPSLSEMRELLTSLRVRYAVLR
jgi:hypothetical protein